jgi:hypothetical protein
MVGDVLVSLDDCLFVQFILFVVELSDFKGRISHAVHTFVEVILYCLRQVGSHINFCEVGIVDHIMDNTNVERLQTLQRPVQLRRVSIFLFLEPLVV